MSRQLARPRDHVAKDASRALDYAETRWELDHGKVAYYGYSWGSVMGALIPAVEPRIKTCVLALGGLNSSNRCRKWRSSTSCPGWSSRR